MSKKVKIFHPIHGENKCYTCELEIMKANGWSITRLKTKNTKPSEVNADDKTEKDEVN